MNRGNKRKILTIIQIFATHFEESEEDEEMMALYLMQNKPKKRRTCIENYEEVISSYNPRGFRNHFRLEKTTVQVLLEKFGNDIYEATSIGGRPSNPTKQILVTLWMLANQETYRSIADRFDISISSAWEYLRRVVNVLIKHIKDYIKWPTNITKICEQFKQKGGIANVAGAIDGSHISIVTPSFMPNSYLNRKQFHSIVLQAVCDADYMFTDCFAGCPGSVHDARVFRMSPLSRQIDVLLDKSYHLLGDSAYLNSTYIVTPYKDNGYLNPAQKRFNMAHSSTRVCIEQAFGLLKGRFHILKHVNIYRIKCIPDIIIACCILHNICMKNNDTDVDIFHEEPFEDINVDSDRSTTNKRDVLCRALTV